ncbi:MAG: energy-coupling factor transporter transmembrane protein EcfT [Pseudanabaenaceae cyanobacterium]
MRSLTVGLYVEQPQTWLHRLDARVKLLWLSSLLLSTILASTLWRVGLAVFLVAVTLATGLPWRVTRSQMGLLLLLAGMTFLIALVSGDSLNVTTAYLRPLPDALAIANGESLPLTLPDTGYRFELFSIGAVRINRATLDFALRVGSLIFTFLYAPSFYLLVTPAEEIAAAIAQGLAPFSRLGVPTVELTLTLTLALRFLPLVLEEIQNLVRAILTRGIVWRRLGWKRSLGVWLAVGERLATNLFNRAEQAAAAMTVRGCTVPSRHRVPWGLLPVRRRDGLAGALLLLFWGLRIGLGGTL